MRRELPSLDLNFLFSLLRFRTFRQHDRQHALLEARGGLICVSILWHLKRTLEGAEAPLPHIVIVLLFFFLVPRTLSPLMPDRGQQSDHRDARSRRKAGLKRT